MLNIVWFKSSSSISTAAGVVAVLPESALSRVLLDPTVIKEPRGPGPLSSIGGLRAYDGETSMDIFLCGCLSMTTWIRRKKAKVKYPSFQSILYETYGYSVYYWLVNEQEV